MRGPLKIPANMGSEAKNFILALLNRNPNKRLGSGDGDAEEVKQHKFLADVDWNKVAS